MRFQFNLQTCTLKITQDNHSLVLPEELSFPYFRSVGFILDPDQPEHRILFSVCKERVQTLYQIPQDGLLVRYKREIVRPPSGIVEIEFSEWDRIKKNHD